MWNKTEPAKNSNIIPCFFWCLMVFTVWHYREQLIIHFFLLRSKFSKTELNQPKQCKMPSVSLHWSAQRWKWGRRKYITSSQIWVASSLPETLKKKKKDWNILLCQCYYVQYKNRRGGEEIVEYMSLREVKRKLKTIIHHGIVPKKTDSLLTLRGFSLSWYGL